MLQNGIVNNYFTVIEIQCVLKYRVRNSGLNFRNGQIDPKNQCLTLKIANFEVQ